MDDKTKKEFISLFNQGFEEVVAPSIDDLSLKIDKVENRLEKVENRLESLERKVDNISAKQFDDQEKLREHDKRMKRLEISRITA